MSDRVDTDRGHLAALERRGDEVEAFCGAREQAEAFIREHGTQALVDTLRAAVVAQRRIRMGTINTLVLLRHIELLEAHVAGDPVRLP